MFLENKKEKYNCRLKNCKSAIDFFKKYSNFANAIFGCI